MTHEPIQTLEIENYGCIKKASFSLSSLHALIGPNDSGKSTALRAIRTATQFAVSSFQPGTNNELRPFDPLLLDMEHGGTSLYLGFGGNLGYRLFTSDASEGSLPNPKQVRVFERACVNGIELPSFGRPREHWHQEGLLRQPLERGNYELMNQIATAVMVRFDPDDLREPAQLIPEDQGIKFADERGTGLASVFDAIINRDAESFSKLQADVRSRFPSVAKVGLKNITSSLKEMAVTLTDGTRVGAKAMSEGLLYYLGFAALKYIDESRLFLVEEPENGLHPARIAEVMKTLREISKTNQVIIATHSPLVVNELEGHEVSVVTRDPEQGTQTVLLKDVPGFQDASKIYRPGEFWVSYCDGNQEEPLLKGNART